MTTWTYDDKIIGKLVSVLICEAREHGENRGCVCNLIGATVTVESRFEDPLSLTPAYRLVGIDKLVRRKEVELLE